MATRFSGFMNTSMYYYTKTGEIFEIREGFVGMTSTHVVIYLEDRVRSLEVLYLERSSVLTALMDEW